MLCWCDPLTNVRPKCDAILVSCDSASAFALVPLAGEPEAPYGPGRDPHEPSDLELRVYTREALVRLFHGGEREADEAEARLVEAARARGGLWLRIGQGLRALKKGRRLQALAFRFPDYAREIGIGRSRAYELAAFSEALETRPVLREAVRSGRVKYRAAQEVMPLAVGEAEAYWVKKAETETVRALERSGGGRTRPGGPGGTSGGGGRDPGRAGHLGVLAGGSAEAGSDPANGTSGGVGREARGGDGGRERSLGAH